METLHLTHGQAPVCSLQAEACVLAMGFFDGVHLGHRQVIAQAKQLAEKKGLKLAVMTFFPHPKEVLSRGKIRMDYLTPLEIKEELFAQLGVDRLYIVKFDEFFAQVAPKEFIRRYVIDLGVVHVVAGFDFTYGWKGQGNMETIRADGDYRFQVTTVSKIEHGGRKISSTLIRELLSEGKVHEIAAYLGSDYETRGEILLYGLLGGSLKAEISSFPYYTLPNQGAYKIKAFIDSRFYQGIAYVPSKINASIITEIELFNCNTLFGRTVKIQWLNQLSETGTSYAENNLATAR